MKKPAHSKEQGILKNCEHFKDLILTDYLDGRLDQKAAATLEGHLLDCSDCRAFFKEVKTNAIAPFQQAGLQPVPQELWAAIKERLEHKTNPWGEFIEGLKGWLVIPRMVPVMASLMLMLIVGSVSVNTIQVQRAQEKDQGEYLVSLLGQGSSTVENNDLGTPIEHYFL